MNFGEKKGQRCIRILLSALDVVDALAEHKVRYELIPPIVHISATTRGGLKYTSSIISCTRARVILLCYSIIRRSAVACKLSTRRPPVGFD